jgi:DNA polymerase III subunit gamma/tau
LYEPLHHKYRPQTFAQLVGQGAIASTLTHALQQNRIAPAYLFCGPRGTGKTSSARILAKSLNCLKSEFPTAEPCGRCDVCQSVNRGSALDIVEIDAASNTGVDNIRELIERAQFAPVQCRYKVYVIDECHMLSTAAFNALLKTLEEPPDRVVFVLATTDPQRVLPTIISRCQRFDFRRIPLPTMIQHLHYIATQESIQIAEAAVQLVAQIAQGGLRDAESLLDQLSLQADEITVEAVWDLVGAVPERDLLNLVRAIAADDGTALLERTRHLMDKGREPLIVLQSLVGFYRDLLIAKSAPARIDMVAITPPTWAEMTDFAQKLSTAQLLAGQQKLQLAEIQVKNTTQPRLWLEITLTGLLPSALGAIAQLTTAPKESDQSARSVLSVANPPTIAPLPSRLTSSSPIPPAATTSANSVAQQPVNLPVEPSADPSDDLDDLSDDSSADLPIEQVIEQNFIQDVETFTAAMVEVTDPNFGTAEPPAEKPVETPVEAPAEDPFEPPKAEVAFGTLDQLWQQILAALIPRGTQMLMSQQGSLLSFDGVTARVGFRSASLQKMAQQRVPNLEAAFDAVFQRPIKVSLEVLKAADPPEKKTDQTAESPPSAPSRSEPSRSAPPVQNSQPSAASNYSPPHPELSSTSHKDEQAADGTPSGKPAPTSPSVNGAATNGAVTNNAAQGSDANGKGDGGAANNAQAASEAAHSDEGAVSRPQTPAASSLPSAGSPADQRPEQWAVNQEQDNIKRFAQFFNGQIVNLDDIDDLSGRSPDSKSPPKKSSDPGPDVPF